MRTTQPGRAGSRESGVVLMLTLAILFVAIALSTQLALGSSVVHGSMRNRADRVRMELAARSAADEVFTLLKDDAMGGEGASPFGAALGAGGFGGAAEAAGALAGDVGGGGGEASGEGAGGEGEEAADFDSFEDAWAKPMRIVMGDLEITTFVQDENSKYSLLLLADPDPERREAHFERVVRILDALREDFDDDLSETEARAVAEDIQRWLEPDYRGEELPVAPRHSLTKAREEAETAGAEVARTTEVFALPRVLEELLLLEHVDENLFYDQVRGDRIAPGLETVFTVHTSPAFDPPSGGDLQGPGGAPVGGADPGAGGGAGAEGAGGPGGPDDAAGAAAGGADGLGGGMDGAVAEGEHRGEGGMRGVLEGDPPIGAAINLNTAPRAVVEGLMPEHRLPRRLTTAILRWRNEVDEDEVERQRGEERDYDDLVLQEALFGEDRDDPKQVFRSLEDLRKVPGFEEGQLPPDVEQEFTGLLGVKSDVFRVELYVRVMRDPDWQPTRYYEEPVTNTLRLSTVVWRRNTPDGPRIVQLLPWRRALHTRWRIPDFQRDLPPFEPPVYR